MATLEQRGDNAFRLIFYYGGKRYSQRVDATSIVAANKIKDSAEEQLDLIKQGRVQPPDGTDLGLFVVTAGRVANEPTTDHALPLGDLFDLYRESLPNGSIEDSTLLTIRIHLNHLARILKSTTSLTDVDVDVLQRYVNNRLKESNRRGTTLSPVTVKKEIATLSCMWSWAFNRGKVHGHFPGRGLKYGKTVEPPRFQTYAEITRQINRGGAKELWHCLYLNTDEIKELLAHIKKHSRYPYLHPMLVTAAHTGARRSELLRSDVDDGDFNSKTITFRERKRNSRMHTLRTVPMSTVLNRTLKSWMSAIGPTFHIDGRMVKKGEAHNHLVSTLRGSKWSVVRGYHVLRHSAASNLAAAGTDQRTIDAILGHQNEATARRYRHCFPQSKRTP